MSSINGSWVVLLISFRWNILHICHTSHGMLELCTYEDTLLPTPKSARVIQPHPTLLHGEKKCPETQQRHPGTQIHPFQTTVRRPAGLYIHQAVR